MKDRTMKEHTEPRCTLNGVVKYMLADPTQREKILHDFKYPDPEGKAQGDYYGPARSIIRSYHDAGNDRAVMECGMKRLEEALAGANSQKACKVDNNLRAVRCYLGHFGDRKFKPLPHDPRTVMCEGVALYLRPDLLTQEGNRTRLIRFGFSKDGIGRDESQLSVQLLAFYARSTNLEVGPADCLLLTVADGSIGQLTGSSKKFEAHLKASMREINRQWQFI